MVAERGGVPDVAKVVDFGLVKEIDKCVDITRDGLFAGTPHYMAPEMISSPDSVGPQADLYSMGCLGYYLLTGSTVFDGGTVIEVCSCHLHSRPAPPGERIRWPLPATLTGIVMACLEKRPEMRPRSVRHLLELLDACGDVPMWTHARAQDWWSVRGREALGRRRDQRFKEENRSGSEAMARVSVICPAHGGRQQADPTTHITPRRRRGKTTLP